MLDLTTIVRDWRNDKTPVANIDLLFRALSHPVARMLEDHHALVFAFSDGDLLTVEYGDIGISLLYTSKSRARIRAYENIMGLATANVEVYGISAEFDKTVFAGLRLCDVFAVIEELKGEFRADNYSAMDKNCQDFVKAMIFRVNNNRYPYIVFIEHPLGLSGGGMLNYHDDDEYVRGGYRVVYLNGYYSGKWDVNKKVFVEKWSCVIL